MLPAARAFSLTDIEEIEPVSAQPQLTWMGERYLLIGGKEDAHE
jgi:hypothetical protein